jgi:hypothetical protein
MSCRDGSFNRNRSASGGRGAKIALCCAKSLKYKILYVERTI